MAEKTPRKDEPKRRVEQQGFQDPPSPKPPQDTEHEYEEATTEQFGEPTPDNAEEAAAAETRAAVLGVDAQLLDIKHQVEEQLKAASMRTRALAEDTYTGMNNIVGVGIALGASDYGQADGMSMSLEPGMPCLQIYVVESTSADVMKSVMVESMGISVLSGDDVPLSIVRTGFIDAQPHRFRMRPAPGGISAGHFRITAGTLGCLATGLSAPRNSRLMILSNNHVLANSNNAAYGDCICQPGPYDGGACPKDQIAILERFVPINFSGGTVNYVDAATGWAWPDRVRKELVYLQQGQPRFFTVSSAPVAAQLGMLVGKSGRTTQITTGRIMSVGVSVNVGYGGGRVAHFRDQIGIKGLSGDFSAGGDSGSLIWTWDGRRSPVGLLFAGGGGWTFANRITHVLSALAIRLYT